MKKREAQKSAWRSGTDIKDKPAPERRPSGPASAGEPDAAAAKRGSPAGGSQRDLGKAAPLAALAPAPKVQVNWYKKEGSSSADATMAAIMGHDFKQQVRELLVSKLMSTLGDIISREKQLQDIGGGTGKLSLRFKEEWKENEAALAMIPFEAVDVAHRHNDLYANNFHDPLTLLKSRQFYGRLLQAPPRHHARRRSMRRRASTACAAR